MDSWLQLTDLVAVAVFAISGALAAAQQKLDVLGFILLAAAHSLAMPVAMGMAFLLRASAIVFDLRLPKYGR